MFVCILKQTKPSNVLELESRLKLSRKSLSRIDLYENVTSGKIGKLLNGKDFVNLTFLGIKFSQFSDNG